MPTRILIVEDEADIAFLIERTLKKEGFLTEVKQTGRNIHEVLISFKPDLVLLDVMLPDADGYLVCRMIKALTISQPPKVIMITARTEENDILKGFQAGADDFIKKPFQLQEVIARCKAIMRRHRNSRKSGKNEFIQQGPISIDNEKHEAHLHGKTLKLTFSEYRLLHQMVAQPNRVFTREQLGDSISQTHGSTEQETSTRNIDVHIRSLRKKLGSECDSIRTQRGIGYYFQNKVSPVGCSC